MPDKQDTLAVDVKHCDIPDAMRDVAIQLSVEAVSTFDSESKMASFIKKEFDKRYDGKWHCVVGRAYGSYVTHDQERFIYIQVGNEVILLFKST